MLFGKAEKTKQMEQILNFQVPAEGLELVLLLHTLQMFAGIYRNFAGKSESGDFKFTGIECIPTIPVIFEVNQK